MEKIKPILLLFLMGLMLFPWQMLCLAHPTGHDHHHHDEPGPCELREIHKGETSFLPPMHCHTISVESDDYNQTENQRILPTTANAIVAAVVFQLLKIEIPCTQATVIPEARCNTGPPLAVFSLRGPPIV
ncbi:MAG: hypothetical protein H0X62_00870 [Bacteroidetes bacterium]|nr:hypothetical protein [Bacteroidota bacterium]